MARPTKQGLDYYSTDVDIYSDDKVKFVSAIFELEGEAVLYRLLSKIYRIGYYSNWNDDEAMLFAIDLPSRDKSINALTQLVNDVVSELVKRDFFSRDMYEKYKILTSTGIQKRYLAGTEKRKCVEIDARYWLLKNEESSHRDNLHFFGVNSHENEVSSPGNSIKGDESTQSKVKESKVNKRVKDIGADAPPMSKSSKIFTPPTLEEIRLYCKERGNNVDPERFFQYYEESGWVDSEGRKVRNWKQRMITWEGRSFQGGGASNKANAAIPAKKNRFANFPQRENNYAELEKMEQEYLRKSLEK